MGRPRATSSNRDFALTFSNCVTAASTSPFDWVARKGQHSIFEVLRNLAPKVRKMKKIKS